MKRWFLRTLKFGVIALVSIAVLAAVWFVRQPHLADDHAAVRSSAGSAAYESAMGASRDLAVAIADSLDLPSLSLAAAVNGEVVWIASLGHQDMKAETPAGPGTLYRTGSIAKAITSVVLGRAVDAGQVDLDRTVGSYLGERAGAAGEATLRQLAGHQGGVRHYVLDDFGTAWSEQFSQRHWDDAQEALELFADDPTLFDPGTDFHYSTHGYTLLSAVLEEATGQNFLDLLDADVAGPLGLTGTGPDDVRAPAPERATTYVRLRDRYVDPFQVDPSYKWAGGGLLSTPTDLVTLAASLMDGTAVQPETLRDLWRPQPLADGRMNPQNYAMGWRIDPPSDVFGTPEPLRAVHHGGSIVGGSSFLLLIPERDVAVAVMTNLSLTGDGGSRLRAAAYRMAATFLEIQG